MEAAFKVVFFLSIVIFCFTIVGFFVLFLKILLLFNPEINLMGVTMTATI